MDPKINLKNNSERDVAPKEYVPAISSKTVAFVVKISCTSSTDVCVVMPKFGFPIEKD